MKKRLLATLIPATVTAMVIASTAHAAAAHATTYAATDSATIKQGLAEGTAVQLSGEITQHLRGDTYLLRDNTGTIEIEIDGELINRQVLPNGTHLSISGDVDHDDGQTQVDVNRVNTIQGVDPAGSVMVTTSAAVTPTTVEGTAIRLQGQIVKHLHEDTYQLRDSAGTVEVEIGRDLTQRQILPNGTQVDVTGTVEHDDGRTQVDVNRVNTINGASPAA